MADLTYGENLAEDVGGRKMLSALTDNGGTNEFVALRGVNRQTQNGEPVVDLPVAPAGITAPGQATMAASLPVVIASNQSAVPVTPAGITAAGQATMAASLPVAIASNQSAVPVTPAGITAPGQATMAASLPVVIASNQSAVSVHESDPRYLGRGGGSSFTAVATRNFSVTGYGTPEWIGGGASASQVIVRCSSGYLYVGDAAVVPETGFRLSAGDIWVFDLGPGLMLWGVSLGGATATANVMEFTIV